MSDLGRGPLSAGLMVFKAQLLGAIVQDVARYDVRDIQASIVEREEQQRVRDELLGSLGAVRTFSVGAAIVAGPDGQPDPRLATAVVTADELVLLEAHVAIAPDEIIGRIPLAEITGIRLLERVRRPGRRERCRPRPRARCPAPAVRRVAGASGRGRFEDLERVRLPRRFGRARGDAPLRTPAPADYGIGWGHHPDAAEEPSTLGMVRRTRVR
jgi:hypothetical protein